MLSIGKLSAARGGAAYYERAVASGREDYYAGAGEARGQWLGGGSDELGLSGALSAGQLEALVGRGEHPLSGDALRRSPSGRPLAPSLGVQGFDLTFSAPKSVSVLFGIAEGEVSRAVRDGHDAAVREALGYLERRACGTRLGKGGAVKVDGGGFVGAAFRHRASRAGDPQLHTHVVVANATRAPDGRWRALDGRRLYEHARTAGYLYEAALRRQLSDRLGVRWRAVERGIAEIDGVPQRVLERFSSRRAEIVRDMAARGEAGASAARAATLRTRRSKERSVDHLAVRERWQRQARDLGFGPGQAARVLDRPAEAQADRERVIALVAGEGGGLTEVCSTFERKDVLRALAERFHQGLGVEQLEVLADRYLASPLAVPVASQDGRQRYTTVEMLDVERELVDGAAARQDDAAGLASAEAVEQAIGRRPTLAPEQAAMVRTLCRSGRGVEVVRAPAGSGKTYALDACREAWRHSNLPVGGCALSAQAAGQLADAGIPSTTIAQLEHQIADGRTLRRFGVLIVDEAGMVGTRTLARLAQLADQADTKLVLVGDDRQLPELDAGGGFRALADRLGAIELHANRRQQHAWDRDALAALRDGDPHALLDAYQQHGRLHTAATLDASRDALVRDWWQAACEVGAEQAVMIAMRREDVRDLNTRARIRMRDAGLLSDTELDTGYRRIAVGERVICRHNDRHLALRNGDRGQVTAIHDDGRVELRLDNDRELTLPPTYVTGLRRDHQPYLDHGYATTAHAVQGATVQQTFIAASEDTYREWGYTALTRHRTEARFYTVTPDTEHARDPLAPLTRALAASRAKHLALDQLDRASTEQLQDEQRRLRDLIATYPARAAAALQRLDHHETQLRQRIATTPPGPERQALRTELEQLAAVRTEITRHAGDPERWLEHHADAAGRLRAVDDHLAGRPTARPSDRLAPVPSRAPGTLVDGWLER